MIISPFDMALPLWLSYGISPSGVFLLLVVAISIESAILSWLKWENPIRISIIMNLISTVIGFCNPIFLVSSMDPRSGYFFELLRTWYLASFGSTLVIEGFVLLVSKKSRNFKQVLAATLLTNFASYTICTVLVVLIL